MSHRIRAVLVAGLVGLGLLLSPVSNASVVVANTRIVYNGQDSETTVRLTNQGPSPGLVQIWIDKGDPASDPGSIDVPFVITPPVARIDPGKTQTLRLVYTGEALPQNRESVFWFNVLEIPPKATGSDADGNFFQVAYRTRIKLFYRPKGLKGKAADAPASMTWRLKQENQHAVLQVTNPSPYHVSFTQLKVDEDGKTASAEGGMVGPGESKPFPLRGGVTKSDVSKSDGKVSYTFLNDYGGDQTGESPLQKDSVQEQPASGLHDVANH